MTARQDEGDQEQKSHDENEAKGKNAVLNKSPETAPGLWFNAPDQIEGSLHLPENPRSADDQVPQIR